MAPTESWTEAEWVDPGFLDGLFGWRYSEKKGRVPNIADSDSVSSVAIASELFAQLGVTRRSTEKGQTLGRRLEAAVQAVLADGVPRADPARRWDVGSKLITEFWQYQHLARLDELISRDTTNTLSVEIGRDYLVRPDVTVGMRHSELDSDWMLHAAISCKFTIRSDRVQNIRHEGVILTRHRRGRQPHIVTVTCEPLPSRLAAIARGTGEVDGVYHVALEQLQQAVAAVDNLEQREILDEIVDQRRLFDLQSLVPTLVY